MTPDSFGSSGRAPDERALRAAPLLEPCATDRSELPRGVSGAQMKASFDAWFRSVGWDLKASGAQGWNLWTTAYEQALLDHLIAPSATSKEQR